MSSPQFPPGVGTRVARSAGYDALDRQSCVPCASALLERANFVVFIYNYLRRQMAYFPPNRDLQEKVAISYSSSFRYTFESMIISGLSNSSRLKHA